MCMLYLFLQHNVGCIEYVVIHIHSLYMALRFHKSVVSYFYKVDKITSGVSHKTLKLWEIHNYIFTNVPNL